MHQNMTEPTTTAVALRHEEPSAVEGSPELSIEEVIRRRKLIERLMREEVLVEGRHFGRVKGIPKPFLWQAGAELICQLFRFRPEYQHVIERRFEPPYYEVTSTCRLYHISSGALVGEAVGVANCLEKRGWSQAPFGFANAILKMADKRAHNSAAKSATAASDFFSVDEDQVDQVDPDRPARGPQRPTAPAETASPVTTPPQSGTPAQIARYMGLRKKLGLSADRGPIIRELSVRLRRTIGTRDDVTFEEWEAINADLATIQASEREPGEEAATPVGETR